MMGVADDLLMDRAFVANTASCNDELANIHDTAPSIPRQIANALAIADLARAYEVPASAVRQGLRT